MNKYISWRRVSTQKQGRSGLGLEAQKDIINYFIEKDNGLLLADYEEIYTGTELSKCTELRKAIEHAKKENAKLIIAKCDRFRNTLEALQVLAEIGENNIVFCDLPNSDKFTLTLLFSLAEREALLVSIRTKAALAAKKKRNEQTGGTKELWGKNSSTDRIVSINKMQDESANKRRENARVNESNVFFWAFITDWIKDKGEPRNYKIWGDIAQKLNNLNQKTATGMEYNSVRAAAMYRKLKKIMK
mgnify:FL=1